MIAAASEPAPGSENSWHHVISPRNVGPTHRSHCSGVPCWEIVWMIQPVMPRLGTFAPRSSCSITSCSAAEASRPHGGGQCGTR